MIVPFVTITITRDKELLQRQWNSEYADKHAGKTYKGATINFDDEGWAQIDNARFHPCCFEAEPKTMLFVAKNMKLALEEKSKLESKGVKVHELYANPDNHGLIDIFASFDPKRTQEILGRVPDPREWI